MDARVAIPDDDYVNFRRVLDRSPYGKRLYHDVRELLLRELSCDCYKCFTCARIYNTSKNDTTLFVVKVGGPAAIYHACSEPCASSMELCVKTRREFGDYD